MRQQKPTNQLIPRRARIVGNILMGLGVATPFIGHYVMKMLPPLDNKLRVVQAIFIGALLLFIAGILVKNYWKGGQQAAQKNPFDMGSTAYAAPPQQAAFDWTGVGCSLMVLGPGLGFILGLLFSEDFEYAPIVGALSFVLFTLIGNSLYGAGKKNRAAKAQAESVAKSPFANGSPFAYPLATTGSDPMVNKMVNEIENPSLSDANLPQIIIGRRPEGFVLVDHSEATGCGVTFFGIFSAIWYGFTLLMLFIVMTVVPDEGSTTGGVIGVIVFLLAGLIPLSLFIRLARAKFAFKKPAELLLKNWPLEVGDDVEMDFRCALRRNLTVMSIDVSLECKKTDRSGSETETRTLDKRALTVREFKQDGKAIIGNWKIAMPTTWQLPCESSEKAIGWQTFVTVELAEGPKGVFSFPLLVMPKRELETGDRGDKTALP
jgi:hypothetical protein